MVAPHRLQGWRWNWPLFFFFPSALSKLAHCVVSYTLAREIFNIFINKQYLRINILARYPIFSVKVRNVILSEAQKQITCFHKFQHLLKSPLSLTDSWFLKTSYLWPPPIPPDPASVIHHSPNQNVSNRQHCEMSDSITWRLGHQDSRPRSINRHHWLARGNCLQPSSELL